MEIIQSIMDFFAAHSLGIVGALLGISEGLALIPALKSNSILQLVINSLKKMAGKE